MEDRSNGNQAKQKREIVAISIEITFEMAKGISGRAFPRLQK